MSHLPIELNINKVLSASNANSISNKTRSNSSISVSSVASGPDDFSSDDKVIIVLLIFFSLV